MGSFEETVLGFAAVLAIIQVVSIGANDGSNSCGIPIGCGVLSPRKAIMLTCIMEFAGASLLGAGVGDTIRSKIVNAGAFEQEPRLLMLGFLCGLFGATLWVVVATFCAVPISTTHAIVGGVVGFAVIERGLHGIYAGELGTIVASWFASPLLGGACAYGIFWAINRLILQQPDPARAAFRRLWLVYFLCSFVLALYLVENAIAAQLRISAGVAVGVSLGIATMIAVSVQVVLHARRDRYIGSTAASASSTSIVEMDMMEPAHDQAIAMRIINPGADSASGAGAEAAAGHESGAALALPSITLSSTAASSRAGHGHSPINHVHTVHVAAASNQSVPKQLASTQVATPINSTDGTATRRPSRSSLRPVAAGAHSSSDRSRSGSNSDGDRPGHRGAGTSSDGLHGNYSRLIEPDGVDSTGPPVRASAQDPSTLLESPAGSSKGVLNDESDSTALLDRQSGHMRLDSAAAVGAWTVTGASRPIASNRGSISRSGSSDAAIISAGGAEDEVVEAGALLAGEEASDAGVAFEAMPENAIIRDAFSVLLVCSSALVGFAHGSNDVSHGIGPFSAIWSMYRSGDVYADRPIPEWIMLLGGAGIVVGLVAFGWRVIQTVGKGITRLTIVSGFAAQFSTAMTVLCASAIRVPVSTTHTLVGAITGVAIARLGTRDAVDVAMLRKIGLSWLITVPAAASVSIICYSMLRSTAR